MFVAVGDQGELFVTETVEHRYTVLDSRGKRVLTIGSEGKPPFEEGDPHGIATDGEGNAYVASGTHKVQKFNRHGEVVKSVGKEGENVGEFEFPRGIGIQYHNHQVYVCDKDNGTVQVFDSDLNFVRSFGTCGDSRGQLKNFVLSLVPLFGGGLTHAGLTHPKDIDFDIYGNIYTLDYSKCQVFSENGQYLYHFVVKVQREGRQGWHSWPGGLCVSRDYVYITDWLCNCVSVFRKSGEFVHSFGRGELNSPRGIAIDQDGFVFVCDSGNNCILVF